MAVEVHVEGRIVTGKLPDFMQAVKRYGDYAEQHGYTRPKVLLGLSGPMNTVRLVYTYPDLAAYERDETRTAEDRGYGGVAMEMPYADGTLAYSVFKVIE
jgi:hypothetical protein